MSQTSVQFAPLERAQAVGACRRRSVQFLARETTRDSRHSFAAPARNVGITWKVILLLWLLFLAALVLRASVPAPILKSVAPDPLSAATVEAPIQASGLSIGRPATPSVTPSASPDRQRRSH
jgi:hypothetical protein